MDLLKDKRHRDRTKVYKLPEFLDTFNISIDDLAADSAPTKREAAHGWLSNDNIQVQLDPKEREVRVVALQRVIKTIKFDQFYFIKADDLDKEG